MFKEKLDGNGQRTKFKARIVAKDFSQVPGQDFTEIFSSVAKFTTLRIFLALAAYLDFEIHHVDVVTAYLQGNLDEEIYMEVPKGIEHLGSGSRYWKLKKALYGLKQAGRQWKKRLHDVLLNLISSVHLLMIVCTSGRRLERSFSLFLSMLMIW